MVFGVHENDRRLFDFQRTKSTMSWHIFLSTMSWHSTRKYYGIVSELPGVPHRRGDEPFLHKTWPPRVKVFPTGVGMNRYDRPIKGIEYSLVKNEGKMNS